MASSTKCLPEDLPVAGDLRELDGRSRFGPGFTLGSGCKAGGVVEELRVWSKSAFKEDI